MSPRPATKDYSFRPGAFDAHTIEQAMGLAITPEPGTTTAERQAKETPYLVADMARFLSLASESCLLDYGCGPGRIARELIARFGCRVIGVDENPYMRLLAPEYVVSDRFVAWSPTVLDAMVGRGFQFDGAICIWVLQHAQHPQEVISRIERSLKPGALLYAVNQVCRCLPTDKGWIDDDFDVRSALARTFTQIDFHTMPRDVCTAALAASSMIQVLRKK
jgi:2-polyprenyl-3-methyl-5-hydroxy-6-metoxy-1,4-benzoquinol methylase